MTAVDCQVSVFLRWLFVVYQTYNDVPFHNFKHAFTVTQMVRQAHTSTHWAVVVTGSQRWSLVVTRGQW